MKSLLFFLFAMIHGGSAIAMTCGELLKQSAFAIDDRPLKIEEIHYKVFGQKSKPALVLIHGLDSSEFTFQNVVATLAQDFYIITYDQRGHGKTAEGGFKFNTSTMARDLEVLLNHLEISKANILGHSMGARTAVRFANLFPERVSSVIVEDMEMHARVARTAERTARVELRASALRDFAKVYSDRESLVAALTPIYGAEATSMSYRRAKKYDDGTFKLLFRPAVSYLYGYQANSENLVHPFKQIKAPILVMQANPEKGTALGDEGLQVMKKANPKAKYVYFENAGHTIHRTDTESFLKVLTQFLKKQSGL